MNTATAAATRQLWVHEAFAGAFVGSPRPQHRRAVGLLEPLAHATYAVHAAVAATGSTSSTQPDLVDALNSVFVAHNVEVVARRLAADHASNRFGVDRILTDLADAVATNPYDAATLQSIAARAEAAVQSTRPLIEWRPSTPTRGARLARLLFG